jgi:hypothetical protein
VIPGGRVRDAAEAHHGERLRVVAIDTIAAG